MLMVLLSSFLRPWLQAQWTVILQMEMAVEGLRGLAASMHEELGAWEQWVTSPEPQVRGHACMHACRFCVCVCAR